MIMHRLVGLTLDMRVCHSPLPATMEYITVKVPRANSAESAKTNCQVLWVEWGWLITPLKRSLQMNRVRALARGGKLINALLGRQPQNNTRHTEWNCDCGGGFRGVYRMARGSWKTNVAINNGRRWVEAQKAQTIAAAKSKCYRVLLCRVAPLVRILYQISDTFSAQKATFISLNHNTSSTIFKDGCCIFATRRAFSFIIFAPFFYLNWKKYTLSLSRCKKVCSGGTPYIYYWSK